MIEYGENFVAKKKKLIYTEIWSLALDPDGTNIICARDNDCNIYDLGMNFVSTILQLPIIIISYVFVSKSQSRFCRTIILHT